MHDQCILQNFSESAWHLSHLLMVTLTALEIRKSDSTAALKQWKHWIGLREIYILRQLSGPNIIYLNEMKEDLSEIIWADRVAVSAECKYCLSSLFPILPQFSCPHLVRHCDSSNGTYEKTIKVGFTILTYNIGLNKVSSWIEPWRDNDDRRKGVMLWHLTCAHGSKCNTFIRIASSGAFK